MTPEERIKRFAQRLKEEERLEKEKENKIREEKAASQVEKVAIELGEWILGWKYEIDQSYYSTTCPVRFFLEYNSLVAWITAREWTAAREEEDYFTYSFLVEDLAFESSHLIFEGFSAKEFTESQILEAIAYCSIFRTNKALQIFGRGYPGAQK